MHSEIYHRLRVPSCQEYMFPLMPAHIVSVSGDQYRLKIFYFIFKNTRIEEYHMRDLVAKSSQMKMWLLIYTGWMMGKMHKIMLCFDQFLSSQMSVLVILSCCCCRYVSACISLSVRLHAFVLSFCCRSLWFRVFCCRLEP